jgi:hypothetical protein
MPCVYRSALAPGESKDDIGCSTTRGRRRRLLDYFGILLQLVPAPTQATGGTRRSRCSWRNQMKQLVSLAVARPRIARAIPLMTIRRKAQTHARSLALEGDAADRGEHGHQVAGRRRVSG